MRARGEGLGGLGVNTLAQHDPYRGAGGGGSGSHLDQIPRSQGNFTGSLLDIWGFLFSNNLMICKQTFLLTIELIESIFGNCL